jgi:dihydrofolate reductase
MRTLLAITQVSLDGVMQGPGGPEEDPSNGFTQGGWAMPFFDEDGGRALNEIIGGDFDLLLGRRTYEIWASYWPHQAVDNPIARAFKRATKYVATRTRQELEWGPSQILREVVPELRRLKASEGPPLHLWGSSNLLQTLIAADVIDEHRLWVFPLVLGQGKRLFESGVPPRGFRLVESRATGSGVLMSTYRPVPRKKEERGR